MRHPILLFLLLLSLSLPASALASPAQLPGGSIENTSETCGIWKTTAYVPYTPSVPNLYTYDGTSVFSGEQIVASMYLPMGTMVRIPGMTHFGFKSDMFRVADRGNFDRYQLDILVWRGDVQSSLEVAYTLTGHRRICVQRPWGGR